MARIMAFVIAMCLAVTGTGTVSAADTGKLNWVEGGKSVELGKVATLDLGSDFLFLNGKDTQQLMKQNHDNPSGHEIGSVFSKDEQQTWAIFFEYEESGHIKDDEKKKIDANAILKQYKKGTEASNKDRPEEEQIHVTGWDVKPFYDDKTHNLTWSMAAEDANKEPLLNYNIRLLTRTGYVSVVLVSDPKNRDQDKKILTEQILTKFTPKQGQRYEDFDSSKDKVSEHGLSALILGGAGLVVAKKVGLLASLLLLGKKFGIILVAALVGIWGWVKSRLSRKNSEAHENDEAPPPPDNDNPPQQQNL